MVDADGNRPTRWYLRGADVVFPLKEGTSIIGRGREAAVMIPDHLASRRHAEIVVNARSVSLRDLGSRNGVYRQGRRLAEGEVTELADGDVLIVGHSTLVLIKERPRGRFATREAAVETIPTVGPGAATGVGSPHEYMLAEANRASQKGDLDRLERTTSLLLDTLGGVLAQGFGKEDPAVRAAIEHALFLAEKGRRGWIENLFTFLETGGIVISIDVLGRVERVLPSAGHDSLVPIDAYIGSVRGALELGGPRGRALLTQLERLTRDR